MASKTSNEDLIRLGEEAERITCPICKEHFVNPKILPCLHSFCLRCLEKVKLDVVKGVQFLHCPKTSCSSKWIIDKGLPALNSSFVVNNLIEAHELIEKVGDQNTVSCDKCTKTNCANRYCKQCNKFFCSNCLHHHHSWKPNVSHDVITLAEVIQIAQRIPREQHKEPICPNHNKPQELFCMTCEELVCQLCTAKTHKNHKYDKVLNETYHDHLDAVDEDSVKPLNQKIEGLKQAKALLSNRTDEINQQGDATFKKIDDMIGEFRECLDREEGKLKGNLKFLLEIKSAVLKLQMCDVDTALSRLTECRDHIQLSVDVGSRHEILSAKAYMRSCSNDLVATVKSAASFEPKEQADVKLMQRNIDAKAVFENIAELPKLTTAANYLTCDIVSHDAPVVGVESTASMQFFLPDGSPAPIPPLALVKCRLTPCCNQDKPIECKVKECPPNTAGQYQIVFTPKSRGRHQLHITLQDNVVRASPVDIGITIPWPPETVPTKTITGSMLREPRGIAVTEKGEVVISDGRNHYICIVQVAMDKPEEDSTIRIIGEHYLRHPRGVAITFANTILV